MKHLPVFILICLFLATGCGGGDGDNLTLNGVTPDDVDCFHDDVNHVEPLPEGSFPGEFITEPSGAAILKILRSMTTEPQFPHIRETRTTKHIWP